MAEILDYIGERNPRAAAAFAKRFEEGARLIGSFPEIGSKTAWPGFRRIIVGSYLMVYELRNSEAIIRYVRHGARKRPWEND